MKIAFLSNKKPDDFHLWSGTTRNIFQVLSLQHEVTWLGGNLTDGGTIGSKERMKGTIQRITQEIWHEFFQQRLRKENLIS